MGSWNYPVAGRRPSLSPYAFCHRGTAPYERWYSSLIAGDKNHTGDLAPVVDFIYAVPVPLASGVINRLGVEVVTLAASGVARLGIYKAISPRNIYPGNLVVDSGEISTATTGVKKITGLSARVYDGLHWLAIITGVAQCAIRSAFDQNVNQILGIDDDDLAFYGSLHVVAQAYAALPATFPDSASINESDQNDTPILMYGYA